MLKYDNRLNEILTGNKPIKPFLDLEKKFNENRTKEQDDNLLYKFMVVYKQAFKNCFNIDLHDDDIIYINSCGIVENNNNELIYKFSYHVIINNDVYFKSIAEQALFIKYVYEYLVKLRIKHY